LSSSERPLVVWCAGVSWSGIAGTDRHMAYALSKFADVLWVDPPVSPVTPGRFKREGSRWPWPRLTSLNASMLRLTPAALPFHSRSPLRATTASLVRMQIRAALRQIRRLPHAVICSHLDDVLRDWGSGVLHVFYGTDDYVGGSDLMGTTRARLADQERRQLSRADAVVAISAELADRWRNLGFSGPMTLVPNGVDIESYRELESVVAAKLDLPKPVAGFVGQLSARVDIGLFESVVAAGCSLLLVGPHQPKWEVARFRALLANRRVVWVGPVPFNELPRYLKVIDVGITPYADSEFNRASFPLKTLEYLSAGKPAVSTDLPAVRWLSSDLITVAERSDFGRVVFTAAQTNSPGTVQRRVAFAASHSWTQRAAVFAEAIGLHST
jgi:teichuronic acid biosynthesis glycosyltransferase TuaH